MLFDKLTESLLLSFIIICTLAILCLSLKVYCELKINFNTATRITFILNIIGLFIRAVATCLFLGTTDQEHYLTSEYYEYTLWMIDFFFFLFYVNDFARVVLSWQLRKKLSSTKGDYTLTIDSMITSEIYQQNQLDVVEMIVWFRKRMYALLTCYLLLTLCITVSS
jgi:hypothetical protein